MIALKQVGAEATAGWLKSKVRLFQREQRVKMRIAGNLVKAEVVHEAQKVFASRGGKRIRGDKQLGPLDRSIGVKVFATKLDVVALVRPRARAFYGRFQETGLDVERKGRILGPTKRRGNVRALSHHFKLPAKPFLEPVALRMQDKVADILGDAYRVFQAGD